MKQIFCLNCKTDNYEKITKNHKYFCLTNKHFCIDCFKYCTNCNEFLSTNHFKRDYRYNTFRSCCKSCTSIKNKEARKKKKFDEEYQLQLLYKQSIKIENKLLREKSKRLCSRCYKPFFIFNMHHGVTCYECLNK